MKVLEDKRGKRIVRKQSPERKLKDQNHIKQNILGTSGICLLGNVNKIALEIKHSVHDSKC